MHILNQESSLCFTVGVGVVPLKEWHQLGNAGGFPELAPFLLNALHNKGGIQLDVLLQEGCLQGMGILQAVLGCSSYFTCPVAV